MWVPVGAVGVGRLGIPLFGDPMDLILGMKGAVDSEKEQTHLCTAGAGCGTVSWTREDRAEECGG